MPNQTFRIIHLSDIHFGEFHRFTSSGATTRLERLTGGSLLESIADDIQSIGATPDLIVISGDLTSTGNQDEFKEIETFLSEICKRFDLDPTRFLIVPGNHDVLWGRESDAASNGDYLTFSSRFFKLPVQEMELPSYKFEDIFFIGLDTTKLLSQNYGGLGVVGEEQLRAATKKVLEASDAQIKFLVLHHHLLPVSWVESGPIERIKSMTLDAPTILAWAQSHGFTGIIHGHQHQHFISTFHLADRKGVPFIITGGASVGSTELPPQTRNGYQWIEIQKRHITFTHRELEGTNKFRFANKIEFVHERSGTFASSSIPSARQYREPSLTELRTLMGEAAAQVIAAICPCYGPAGGLKAVSKLGGCSHVRDGINIIRSLSAPDPVQQRFFEVSLELVRNVGGVIGDGKKTAALIWAQTIKNAFNRIDDGFSDTHISKGIKDASVMAAKFINENSSRTNKQKQIEQIGTTAAHGNESIGNIIAEAMGKIGKEGTILVESNVLPMEETKFLIDIEECKFENGNTPDWLFELMPQQKNEIVLNNPGFFLYNEKLTSAKEILPLLEITRKMQRPLIILCAKIEGEALKTITANTLQGIVTAIPISYSGINLKEATEDISILTGARVIRKEMGALPQNVTIKDLGFANQALLRLDKFYLKVPKDQKYIDRVQKSVTKFRTLINDLESPYERERIQNRLTRIVAAQATIHVNGSSESDIRILTGLIANALNSTRAAVEEGLVRGGGISYFLAGLYARENCSGGPDYLAGVDSFVEALSLPFSEIVKQTGHDIDNVKQSILSPPNISFNYWENGLIEDYLNGPIEPAKLVKQVMLLAGESATRMIRTKSVELTSSGEQKTPERDGYTEEFDMV